MKHFIAKVGILALLSACLVPAGWAQSGASSGSSSGGASASGAAAGPKVTKAEEGAYKAFFDNRMGDPAHLIVLGEAFIDKYPMSAYLFAVYSTLTGAYFQTNQVPKAMDAGNKALFLNPDDIDVLPLMAYVIPRQVNSKTPDAAAQLQKAAGYARKGIALIPTMPKPAGMDDASFEKAKDLKLAYCHSGLGTVYLKTGMNDDAVLELSQAVKLEATPDLVDYYLLGLADETTNHFSDAAAAYAKCAVNGSPLQGACKANAATVKDKAKNSLEAPK